jgi:predicted nucleotidyltransferase
VKESLRTVDANLAVCDIDLEDVTNRLVTGLKPEKIILFGSRARGTQTRRSDLDLFIVQATERAPLERIAEGLRCLPPLLCDADLIIYTPEELAARQEAPFIRRLLREGIVLYER